MRKKTLWCLSCVIGLSLILLSCAPAVPEEEKEEAKVTPEPGVPERFWGLEPVTLKWNSTDIVHGGLTDMLTYWGAQYLERESGGKIHVEVYRYGSLYGSLKVPEQIRLGTIDIANTTFSWLAAGQPELIAGGVAYAWEGNPGWMVSYIQHPLRYAFQDYWARKTGVKYLSEAPLGPWDTYSKEPITCLEDFKGKKFWTYGTYASAYIKAWGAEPVSVSTAEYYTAYMKGMFTVTGQTSYGYLTRKLYELGKYKLGLLPYPARTLATTNVIFVMNRKTFDSLARPYKELIVELFDLIDEVAMYYSILEDGIDSYRLEHEFGVKNLDLEHSNPEEYARICDVAVKAQLDFIRERVAPEVMEAEAWIKQQLARDPERVKRYMEFHEKTWALIDAELEHYRALVEAGKSPEEASKMVKAAKWEHMTYEEVMADWKRIPQKPSEWRLEDWLESSEPTEPFNVFWERIKAEITK